MRNIIKKNKCLLFKHEKNNKTLSNDWPTYCHTGIFLNMTVRDDFHDHGTLKWKLPE